MELIKMEWKRLLRHDSLWIFCALQILLLILVCNPYRLCRNAAPMDYSHRALRLLVGDYDKKELVNDMLQEDIASMEDTLEQYKSGYIAFDDETDVDAEISDLEEKLSKLNGKEMIPLNGVERKRYRTCVVFCMSDFDFKTIAVVCKDIIAGDIIFRCFMCTYCHVVKCNHDVSCFWCVFYMGNGNKRFHTFPAFYDLFQSYWTISTLE